MWRLLLAALVLIAWAGAASAQSIFSEPPREAFGLGLVLAYEGKLATVIQQQADIIDACGEASPWGCITPLGDGCQVHIVAGLNDEMFERAKRNLIARCGGWSGI